MTAYNKGYRLELRLVKHLREQGMRAHRTPGSKTPVDVWAGADGHSFCFQVQIARYFPPAKLEALKDEAKEFGAIPYIAWRDGKKLVIEELRNEKKSSQP